MEMPPSSSAERGDPGQVIEALLGRHRGPFEPRPLRHRRHCSPGCRQRSVRAPRRIGREIGQCCSKTGDECLGRAHSARLRVEFIVTVRELGGAVDQYQAPSQSDSSLVVGARARPLRRHGAAAGGSPAPARPGSRPSAITSSASGVCTSRSPTFGIRPSASLIRPLTTPPRSPRGRPRRCRAYPAIHGSRGGRRRRRHPARPRAPARTRGRTRPRSRRPAPRAYPRG